MCLDGSTTTNVQHNPQHARRNRPTFRKCLPRLMHRTKHIHHYQVLCIVCVLHQKLKRKLARCGYYTILTNTLFCDVDMILMNPMSATLHLYGGHQYRPILSMLQTGMLILKIRIHVTVNLQQHVIQYEGSAYTMEILLPRFKRDVFTTICKMVWCL